MIYIKNNNLNPEEQYLHTKGLFEEVIKLPASLAFNNQIKDFPEIADDLQVKTDRVTYHRMLDFNRFYEAFKKRAK